MCQQKYIHHTTPFYFNDKTKDIFKFVMLNNLNENQNKLFSNQLSYTDVYSVDKKKTIKNKNFITVTY